MQLNDLNNNYQYAMHGLGAYKGLRQTNTQEAFAYWYQKGIRVFEIDFAKTADSRFVAIAHALDDWSLHRAEIFDLPKFEARTQAWFMKQKLFSVSTKGLTPISLESFIKLVDLHRDCIFMLDLFGLFDAESCACFAITLKHIIDVETNLWNHLLLEVYNDEMVEGIRRGSPEAQMIYCVRYEDNLDEGTTVDPKTLLAKKISFISYPWYCSRAHPGELESYAKRGFTVFSRTKYNTKDRKLSVAGVRVNIIAKRFDKWCFCIQYLLYMLSYLKRIFVKLYIRMKYSKHQ